MSRQRTVETLKRLFVAQNGGTSEAVLACLTSDVVFDTFEGVREIGRERVRWVLADRSRRFARETLRDLVLMCDESGGRAAAEFTVRGFYQEQAEGLPPAAGQAYSVLGGAFFDLEGGLVSRASFFLNGRELVRQLSR